MKVFGVTLVKRGLVRIEFRDGEHATTKLVKIPDLALDVASPDRLPFEAGYAVFLAAREAEKDIAHMKHGGDWRMHNVGGVVSDDPMLREAQRMLCD